MRPRYLLVGAIIGFLWGQEEARKRSFIPRTLPQAVARQEALVTIQGLIQDAETKEPLPGASIRLLKSGQGTLSRLDGSFALSMPADALPPDEIVVISYVGYQAKEIPLAEFEKSGALIALTPGGISMKEIQIIASTANVLITPVNTNSGQRVSECRRVELGLAVAPPSGGHAHLLRTLRRPLT
jgi:hypothetical protein